MRTELKKITNEASQALSILSKVRCVEKYAFDSKERFKLIHSWPSKFSSNETLAANYNVIKNKNFYNVKSYPIPYDDFKKHKEVKVKEINKIKISRTIIQAQQILNNIHLLRSIYIIWDMNKNPNRQAPKKISEIRDINNLSTYRDTMLVFNFDSVEYDIKIPVFAYRALLNANKSIGKLPLKSMDRSNFIGKKTDNNGRSKRYIVHKKNVNYLKKTLNKTIKSIDKIIEDRPWVRILKEDGKAHYL